MYRQLAPLLALLCCDRASDSRFLLSFLSAPVSHVCSFSSEAHLYTCASEGAAQASARCDLEHRVMCSRNVSQVSLADMPCCSVLWSFCRLHLPACNCAESCACPFQVRVAEASGGGPLVSATCSLVKHSALALLEMSIERFCLCAFFPDYGMFIMVPQLS